MDQNPILEGNRIEISRLSRTFGKQEKNTVYTSRLLKWQGKDEAQIALPVADGREVPLEGGETFLVCFDTPKGLFCCKATVKESSYETPAGTALIHFVSGFEKYRKRHYYRMVCVLPMRYRVLDKNAFSAFNAEDALNAENAFRAEDAFGAENAPDAESAPGAEDALMQEGTVVDISGGGLRFNAGQAAGEGTEIVFSLLTGTYIDAKLKKLQAKILSCVPLANQSGLTEHRTEFVRITNEERESIIRYIFLEERKRRKKGGDYDEKKYFNS